MFQFQLSKTASLKILDHQDVPKLFALVNHAFTGLGLNRVEIRCATGNLPSQKVAERLGFRLEGVCWQAEWLYDHYVDHNS